jgi:hypothetical protein
MLRSMEAQATSRRRRLGFRKEVGRHFGDTHHLALLIHPAVYEQLCAWVAAAERA